MTYTVAALYRFVEIADAPALQAELKRDFAALDLCGTLLVAPEGINGTLAGTEAAIDAMLDILSARCGLPRGAVKFSTAPTKPFNRLKVRLKREIITFNQPHIDPVNQAGAYVAPADWNALLNDSDVLLLDTRNDYETQLGTFVGAVVPPLKTFTDFAGFVQNLPQEAKQKKVAMFCTGGIRCEKASAYMRAEGFAEVYHLQGGILKYLEDVPAETSRWQGDCYVFDRRMALGHGLSHGDYAMCFSCGYAVDAAGREDPRYEPGVSCAHCYATTSEADKARFRTRQQQIERQQTESMA